MILNSLKSDFAIFVPFKLLLARNTLKNDAHFSPVLAKKRPKATTRSADFWTSLTELDDFMAKIALTFSRLAQMSSGVIRWLRNLPFEAVKVHFKGLSHIWCLFRIWNTSAKSAR